MKICSVYFILSLLISCSFFLQVVRCEPDPDAEVEGTDESVEVGMVGDEAQDVHPGAPGHWAFNPAPGVETICVFPKNPSTLIPAGEVNELVVGVKNGGESSVSVIAIEASVHLPFDHRYLVQNLTAQGFNNSSVPPSAQAGFPYAFAVSKFLQAGSFDLVGTIVYEIDGHPYQNVFYNGTIEVTEPGGLFSLESVFLSCLGVALLGVFVLWIRSRIQQLSKKSKRAPKVEVGTATIDSSMDEWLEGTAYQQALSSKSKKKK